MQNYHNLLQRVVMEGARQQNRTGIDTLRIEGAMLEFDLRQGFPAVTTKKLAFKSVVGELLGFLRGYSNAADFRELGCKIWDQNANENKQWLENPNRKGEDDLGRIYGVQWSQWYDYTKEGVQPPPKLRDGCAPTYLGIANGEGKENHILKGTWMGMIDRCYSEKAASYPLYGGRGVYVCDRWLEFRAFAEDVQKLPGWELKQTHPKGFTVQLDKDNKGGRYYGPNTCAWVTSFENAGTSKCDRVFTVEKEGMQYSFTNISEFCRSQGINAHNFSDLWTGNKNAKTREGFSLVDVAPLPKTFSYPKRGEWGSIDQLATAIKKIQENPEDRRNIVTAWNPSELDQMALPPCHIMHQYICDPATKELSMTMYMRSCDMFLGVPFNIASYALLLSIVAKATGYKPKKLVMFLADVHIYVNHMDAVMEQLTRSPYPLPTLDINMPQESDNALNNIMCLTPEDFTLMGYVHYPAITAPMAV